jgi:hypothetical protein
MSTSALLIQADTGEREDETALTRVQFDGYPEGIGRELLEYFTDPYEVRLLITGGEIRAIQGTDTEYYNNPEFPVWEESVDVERELTNGTLFNTYSVDYIYEFYQDTWYVWSKSDPEPSRLDDILDE